jgi:hypothetical protein
MLDHIGYGGECCVTETVSGHRIGRFWIEVDFDARGHFALVAILTVPEATAAKLRRAGMLAFELDDGRRLRGTIVTVSRTEAHVKVVHGT